MANLASVPILAVWYALGGPEPRRGRASAWWRKGDNPQAISLSNKKECWYDHRDNKGGGVLDLVQHVRGCDRAAALCWLEEEGFIEPRTLTREQRSIHARRREATGIAAQDIAHWRDAFIVELNTRKLAAAEAGDDKELSRAASLGNVLENGSPTEIVREFIRHRASDPADVARLITAGLERNREAQRITAEVVLLIARAAAEDSHDAA